MSTEEKEPTPEEIVADFCAELSPEVRRRVYALEGLQKKYNEMDTEKRKEQAALTKKYHDLYMDLFNKRSELVTGAREPTTEEISDGTKIVDLEDEEDAKKEDKDKDKKEEKKPADGAKKGIPKFWLTALQNSDVAEDIQEHDLPALEYLQDITHTHFEDPFDGFTVIFVFAPNPFFSNSTLSLKVYTEYDAGITDPVKIEGTKIEWKEGKNLTQKQKKKKQRHKGSNAVRHVTTYEPQESFFRLFADINPETDEQEEDEENEEDADDTLQKNASLALHIRDQIVPSAVKFYTGENLNAFNFDFAGGADDDDDEGTQQTGAAPAQECKQQ